MKKNVKELKVGDVFKFEMYNPKGFLILEIIDIEIYTDIPWCKVVKHHYDEPAEDEYDEEDRYKIGDTMPHVFDGDVEVIGESM